MRTKSGKCINKAQGELKNPPEQSRKPTIIPNICTTDKLISMREFLPCGLVQNETVHSSHSEYSLHQRNHKSEEFHSHAPFPSFQTEVVRDLYFLSFHDHCSPICTSALRDWKLIFLKLLLYRLVQKLAMF